MMPFDSAVAAFGVSAKTEPAVRARLTPTAHDIRDRTRDLIEFSLKKERGRACARKFRAANETIANDYLVFETVTRRRIDNANANKAAPSKAMVEGSGTVTLT